MAVEEISERSRIADLLAIDPVALLEPIDESRRGVDGLVTVFADEPEAGRPKVFLAVRWGQRHLGLGSIGHLVASRVVDLAELVAAFPADRGRIELRFPFWASFAISGGLSIEGLAAEARYVVDAESLTRSNAERQCVRLEDLAVIKPMFPKLAEEEPAYVLPIQGELASVAAVTHASAGVARVHVYTVEALRGRGFGRAALLALARDLAARTIIPTATVDLGDERAVRMVEGAGFFQHSAHLVTSVGGKKAGDALPIDRG
jgi:GNAT superfamily N-acetyltransferase